ncbi:hypothetical protein V8F33_008867, partial [Rhypophila sp. PSN 637]
AIHKPGMSDVVIHCDHKRLDNNKATADALFDPTQNSYIGKGSLVHGDSCRQGRNGFVGGMLTRAVVMQPDALRDGEEHSTDYVNSYDGAPNQPEVIQLCASTMEEIRDASKNHGLLNKELIEAVIIDPRNTESSTHETRVIDLLATVEHVFLHEVSD